MVRAPDIVARWAAAKYAVWWPADAECFLRGRRLLVFTGARLLLDTRLPPHAMVVADVDAWHAAHQAGRLAEGGLPLFDRLADEAAQGDLF